MLMFHWLFGRQHNIASQQAAADPSLWHQHQVEELVCSLYLQLDILILHISHNFTDLFKTFLKVSFVD